MTDPTDIPMNELGAVRIGSRWYIAATAPLGKDRKRGVCITPLGKSRKRWPGYIVVSSHLSPGKPMRLETCAPGTVKLDEKQPKPRQTEYGSWTVERKFTVTGLSNDAIGIRGILSDASQPQFSFRTQSLPHGAARVLCTSLARATSISRRIRPRGRIDL